MYARWRSLGRAGAGRRGGKAALTPAALRLALNDLPWLENAALRMRFGLVDDRPYEHGNAEIARRLDITPAQANRIVEQGIYHLKVAHIPY